MKEYVLCEKRRLHRETVVEEGEVGRRTRVPLFLGTSAAIKPNPASVWP
jgi:hypothetical protein